MLRLSVQDAQPASGSNLAITENSGADVAREEAINFRQLNYFRKIIETGNITAAAEILRLAQPALGAQIRRLEEELNVELIVRHSRGVTPTEAGKTLYKHAQRILDDLEQTTREMKTLGSKGPEQLRIGVNSSMILVLGPERLIDTGHTIPNVVVSVLEERTAVLFDALVQGQVDVGFLNNIGEQADLKRKAILEEDLLLVTAPNTGIGEDTISFSEAMKHDLVIGGERSVLRRIVETEAGKLALIPRIAYEVHSLTSMKTMIMQGAVASVMPYGVVCKELKEGALTGRRILRPTLTRILYMVRPRHHNRLMDDPRIVSFLDGLADAYVDIAGRWARRIE